MPGEIWTYNAIKPSDGMIKPRPILIIGNDGDNGLQFVDIHYVLISSSAECGIYDVEINDMLAHKIGLNSKSVIKTTKIYTGSKTKLGKKISDLPIEIKKEFKDKYSSYQENLLNKFEINQVLIDNDN